MVSIASHLKFFYPTECPNILFTYIRNNKGSLFNQNDQFLIFISCNTKLYRDKLSCTLKFFKIKQFYRMYCTVNVKFSFDKSLSKRRNNLVVLKLWSTRVLKKHNLFRIPLKIWANFTCFFYRKFDWYFIHFSKNP